MDDEQLLLPEPKPVEPEIKPATIVFPIDLDKVGNYLRTTPYVRYTKKNKEESKAHRKMAAASRKKNRGK